ncbi:hypothetical protein GCM10027425_00970 [Alteromonas gracilis]
MTLLPVPASADLSLWLGACLRGSASPDDLATVLEPHGDAHLLVGPDEAAPFPSAVGMLRRLGAREVALALPVPGDLVGLAGPRSFNDAALEVGEAVLLPHTGLGMVPRLLGDGLEWSLLPADRPRPLDPLEAGRHLDDVLREATEALIALQAESWSADLADVLELLRRAPELAWPDDLPQRLRAIGTRALLCDRIAELALADESGALSVHEIGVRRAGLVDLARTSRAALVAVCSATP